MELSAQLANDLQNALRDRDMVRVSTLRMLIAAVRNKEIEKQKTFGTAEVLEVVASEAKRRRESIVEYQKGQRPELAAKEEAELQVLQSYLPQALSDAELEVLVRQAIQSVGAKSARDMGRVMGALMPQIKGRADGKQAQQLVLKLLQP